jgi:iron complex transport system permease protein
VVALPLPLRDRGSLRRPAPPVVTVVLFAAMITVSVASLGTGAAGLGLGELASALTGDTGLSPRATVILYDIRLPRLAMGLLVGAALAVSGALMQGLFRNPLADPGIVGVSAGASLGAVTMIVLGGMLPAAVVAVAGLYLLPVAAFLGGLTVTLLLYRVSTQGGRTSVATMLLAGIAVAALAQAVTGILVYMADDRQLRDITFWGLGSLAGASWQKAAACLPLILPVLVLSPLLGRGLNALSLGEAQAAHLGIAVERVKVAAVLGVAAAAGAAVAVAGGIGFVGILVPHLLRLSCGPDHRSLLPQTAILGGTLLVLADMVARSIIAPAELPIGIVTACLGAPVFLWILLRRRGDLGL